VSPARIWGMCLAIAVATVPVRAPRADAALFDQFPGSLWTSNSTDLNRFDGAGTQGFVRQGARRIMGSSDWSLTPYLGYSWRFRTLNSLYYNEHGPMAGIELSRGFLNLGLQQEWQIFPAQSASLSYPSAYLTWYKSIDLLGGSGRLFGIPVLSAPLSSWGRMQHDFNAYEGPATLGFVSQAVDWFKLPRDTVFRTQMLYSWRFRAKNNAYYDLSGPAAGVELVSGPVNLGASCSWERYPARGGEATLFRIYLSSYLDWLL